MFELENTFFSNFLDLVNFSFIFISLYFFFYYKKISLSLFFITILFSLSPFLANDVIFDFWQFPDQNKYVNSVKVIRSQYFEFIQGIFSNDFSNFDIDRKIQQVNFYQFIDLKYFAYFISLIPIPFIETPRSLAFFGKFIFIIGFVIYASNQKDRKYEYSNFNLAILALPTIILYSSVMLKEIYVVVFFYLSLHFAVKRKFIFYFLSLLILQIIRPELIYLSLIFFSLHYIFYKILLNKIFQFNKIRNYRHLFVLTIIFIILLLLFSNADSEYVFKFIEYVNKKRYGYHGEGDLLLQANLMSSGKYFDINFVIDAFFQSIYAPINTKSDSLFAPIFIIENIILSGIFVYLLIILFFKNFDLGFVYLIFFVLLNLSIGLIVINDFAIYRYKASLLIPLILIMKNEIQRIRKNENFILYKS